jgi:valyl-tRNA synthetase
MELTMLARQYNPKEAEDRWIAYWQEYGVYHFPLRPPGEVYSIDTPPPTVSGNLHLGHVYSYSHADFLARFWRMNGFRVFYPMGFDDNGLPTERLVEKRLGITANQVGRAAFIEKCLQVSEEAEADYQALWERLGLSIDWRYRYRTIDARSRRLSQLSFIDLYQKNLVNRRQAPAIWCPECQTAIAQAELDDIERDSEFFTLAFHDPDGENVPIATTRPELLPACVSVFVHPDDRRYQGLIGKILQEPLFGRTIPVLADALADPEKGSGAVMCCTFGDATDVAWWYTYQLPLLEAITSDGRLTGLAGDYAGLAAGEARKRIIATLEKDGRVLERRRTRQSVRVHERCDTPVEYIIAQQWFVNVLDHKAALIEAGESIRWQPEHMKARYRSWVENLKWDWCLSRQRYYGVPFPLWYCQDCGAVMLAQEAQLPVDPTVDEPPEACQCGSQRFSPEIDVMDTWATSSLTPQIIGGWQVEKTDLYGQVFPFSLRPQAHEIIRTWAFYTIVKSLYHFHQVPWKNVLISGWGIAGEGMGKISKSRGGGPLPPMQMIERYSADALRYWAASAGPGKDAVISEDKIQLGTKLATKLWNVARFGERFLAEFHPQDNETDQQDYTPADRWILARLQTVVRRATGLFQDGEYASAKSEIELFFWNDLADNYLEMAKQRLYDPEHPKYKAARITLYQLILTTIKLFAPFLPFITEEIFQGLFAAELTDNGNQSIHTSSWPSIAAALDDPEAAEFGASLIAIASAVRRYKSEHSLPLGRKLNILQIRTATPALAEMLMASIAELASVTRASRVEVVNEFIDPVTPIQLTDELAIAFD